MVKPEVRELHGNGCSQTPSRLPKLSGTCFISKRARSAQRALMRLPHCAAYYYGLLLWHLHGAGLGKETRPTGRGLTFAIDRFTATTCCSSALTASFSLVLCVLFAVRALCRRRCWRRRDQRQHEVEVPHSRGSHRSRLGCVGVRTERKGQCRKRVEECERFSLTLCAWISMCVQKGGRDAGWWPYKFLGEEAGVVGATNEYVDVIFCLDNGFC